MLEEDIKPNKKEYKFLNLAYNRFFELTDKISDENFWEKSFKNPKKLVTNKDTFSSFIAEKMMAGKKSQLLSDVNQSKSAIQFSLKDDVANLRNISENIKSMVNPFDKKTNALLDNVRNNIDVFSKRQSQLAKDAVIEVRAKDEADFEAERLKIKAEEDAARAAQEAARKAEEEK